MRTIARDDGGVIPRMAPKPTYVRFEGMTMAPERLSRLQRRILTRLVAEDRRLRGTMAASHEDLVRALAGLGWYQQHKQSGARAWVIAKEFTRRAWYAAQVCPELTLKWYRVELLTVDPQGSPSTRIAAVNLIEGPP
jgi:hypothetical protein